MDNAQAVETGVRMDAPGAGGPVRPAPERAKKAAPGTHDAIQAPRIYTIAFYLLVSVALFAGWSVRREEHLVAESGPGYALGIIGGGAMLLLLLYPLRKKLRFMQRMGAVRHWFRAHMLLGIIGPVLVLFHANFRFGSTNSTVVLSTTLLVAGSGLAGRYIYTKIHYGLYGRQMTLKELQAEIEAKKNTLASVLGYAPRLQKRLLAFDEAALRQRRGFLSSLVHYFILSLRARWTRPALNFRLARVIKVVSKREGWSARETRRRKTAARLHISEHVRSALKAAEFSVYERLMALWHVFHFPIFILLILAGVAHVVAVHMY